MRKAELMEYGIPEERVKEFHQVYWADVKRQAALMGIEEGRETAPALSTFRQAITATVRLIDDPARLAVILCMVGRHYQQYRNDKNGYSKNARKGTETGQEGGC